MKHKKIAHYFFLAVLLILLYLTFLILKPYATYLLLGLVLAFSFHPTYEKVKKIVKHSNLSAIIVILFILVMVVLPSIFVVSSIIQQAGTVYRSYDSSLLISFSNEINSRFGTNINFVSQVNSIIESFVSFVIKKSPSFVGGFTNVILGIFVMFVEMFYLFKKGSRVKELVMQYLPLKDQYKEDLIVEIENVTHSVVYSQVLVALLQGLLMGISFAIFGLPNPIFWGFIAAIFSFLPVVGAPLIWIPAAMIKILSGNVGVGIGIMIFNAILTSNIDNVMRPRIVSKNSRLHPFMTLIGIIGGLKLFGFIGILLGPMIIALFMVLLKYFNKEF